MYRLSLEGGFLVHSKDKCRTKRFFRPNLDAMDDFTWLNLESEWPDMITGLFFHSASLKPDKFSIITEAFIENPG